MRRVRVTMYQCEHCGHRMWKAKRADMHEKICLRNPKRECYCGRVGILNRQMIEVSERLGVVDDDVIGEIRLLVDGCPRCMLAAVYEWNATRSCGEDEERFQYHEEMKQYDARKTAELNPNFVF